MPKQVYVVSSPLTTTGANFSVLGSTDYGKRILLSDVNGFTETLTTNLWMIKDNHNRQQKFSEKVAKTTFHELMHLLNYTVDMPVSYKEITPEYLFSDWTRYEYKIGEGFISAYSRYSEMEDIAEVFAFYLATIPQLWEERATKDEKIIRKLSLIRSYLEESFGVDIDALRDEYQNRLLKVCTGKVTYEMLTYLN
jgi:substrate import-associated zinc metallohydrolase lipoprotein